MKSYRSFTDQVDLADNIMVVGNLLAILVCRKNQRECPINEEYLTSVNPARTNRKNVVFGLTVSEQLEIEVLLTEGGCGGRGVGFGVSGNVTFQLSLG